MEGGYIEFSFSKESYENDREMLSESFYKQLDKLVEQFPNYNHIRVVLQTRKIIV